MGDHNTAVCEEVTSCCEAFLRSLYTNDVYESWLNVQKDLGLQTHKEMISWLLSNVLPQFSPAEDDTYMGAGAADKFPQVHDVKPEFDNQSAAPISQSEALRSSDALLITLCGGAPLYQQWRRVKCHYGFTSESQFISWVLSLVPQYTNADTRQHSDDDDADCQFTIDYGTSSDYLPDTNNQSIGVGRQLHWKTNFQCLICRRYFANQLDLTEHIETIHLKVKSTMFWPDWKLAIMGLPKMAWEETGFPCKCDLCDVEADTIHGLEKHYQSMHKGYEAFMCKHCGHKFVNNKYLQCHRHRSTKCKGKVLNVRCDLCPAKLESHLQLGKHYTQYHPDYKPYKCGKCGETYRSLASLTNHRAKSVQCNGRRVDKETAERCKGTITIGKSLECRYCKRTFKAPVALRLHMINIHGEDKVTQQSEKLPHTTLPKMAWEETGFPCKCDLCDVEADTIHCLEKHYQSMHQGYEAFMCKHCGKTFENNRYLQCHRRRSTKCKGKVLNVRCDLCPAKLESHLQLSKHYTQYHPDYKPYKCGKCGETYRSLQSLTIHRTQSFQCSERKVDKKTHKLPSLKCEVCNVITASHKDMYWHYRDLHPDFKPYPCERCGKRFRYFRYLQDHHKRALMCNGTISNSLECRHCKRTFKVPVALRSHLINIHGEDKVGRRSEKLPHTCFCSVCNRGFVTRSHLKIHYKRYHSDESVVEKPAKQAESCICETCGKVLASSVCLERHKETHEEKSFRCNICQYETYYTRKFRSHTRVRHSVVLSSESEVKMLQCDECNCQCLAPEEMWDHIEQKHMNVPKITCEVCGKGFLHRHRLKGHMEVHSAETPFQCTQCSKAFKRQRALRRHMQSVHNYEKTDTDHSKLTAQPTQPTRPAASYYHPHQQQQQGLLRVLADDQWITL